MSRLNYIYTTFEAMACKITFSIDFQIFLTPEKKCDQDILILIFILLFIVKTKILYTLK